MKEYSLSFDISTSAIGIALWNENDKLINLSYLKMTEGKNYPEEDRYIPKSEQFKKHIISIKENVNDKYGAVIKHIFVEKPLPNTNININTTEKLLNFNGICCWELYKVFDVAPKRISVHISRKIFCPELVKTTKKKNGDIKETLSFPKGVDKKEYIWEKVANNEPQIDWEYTKNNTHRPTNFDMSDAYCVGWSGLKLLRA